jgi:hypothetical protein
MNWRSLLRAVQCVRPRECIFPFLLGFVILSLLDLLLTWNLVESSGGVVYEANPLAGDILADHGWCGLTWFKLATTAIVVAIGIIIHQVRPRTARWLFGGASAGMSLIVGYSIFLCISQPWIDPFVQTTVALEQSREANLKDGLAASHQYAGELESHASALITEACDLQTAVRELQELLRGLRIDPLRTIRLSSPGLSDEACLALVLIRHVQTALREHPVQQHFVVARLEEQFEKLYGTSPIPDVLSNEE